MSIFLRVSFTFIRSLDSHVLNHTMHNTRIKVRHKSRYSNKTTPTSVVEQHACYKVLLHPLSQRYIIIFLLYCIVLVSGGGSSI